MTVSYAQIHYNEKGTPVADQFDDVYFSNADGLQETEYVFLKNNGLPGRWIDWQASTFVIAETGFGTGLNFLVTVEAFLAFKRQHPSHSLQRLHFVSTEKFPVQKSDLERALAAWPQVSGTSKQLISQYPQPLPGCHRLMFDNGNITLDLWLGDVSSLFKDMAVSQQGLVDAWYLDGFAPSKNPDMWQQSLFEQMVRLARPGCTFSTFTAAGFVKRGLKDAGFTVEKRKGFGHKRDMLAGYLAEPPKSRDTEHAYYRHSLSTSSDESSIAIIGAGLAGANLALSLAQRGYPVTVYDAQQQPAEGASGNRQGGFYPQLNADPSIASQVQSLGFTFASRRYQMLLNGGFDFAHQWCGVLLLAFNQNQLERQAKFVKKAHWPESLLYPVNTEQASELANIELNSPGLFVPGGGWINPPELVNALLASAAEHASVNHRYNHQLVDMTFDGQWHLKWRNQPDTKHHAVVLATGAQSLNLAQLSGFPLQGVRGQVESLPAQKNTHQLATVLCHKGYMTPAYQDVHALGSTYIKNDMECDYRPEEAQTNLQTHQQALSGCEWIQGVSHDYTGRASIRGTLPDHMPMVGAVSDLSEQLRQYADLYKALPSACYPVAQDLPNLYVLTGLGSRGLTTAPLMAELLASQMKGGPLTIGQAIA